MDWVLAVFIYRTLSIASMSDIYPRLDKSKIGIISTNKRISLQANGWHYQRQMLD
ncbi:Uncharacterized protein BM_BM1605 [Brugia malayi]|uniref:Bm1605 n=1 Tax=Brugia malayi TaxID=6279 RepID=A0A4E9FW19_BRUMA|nr:Uncharacterized protein BM_BM1605 [Brugia malayi]VIO99967.1 Uncharacterized protein BM_BM1605 [Brugia malayi]